MFLGVLNDIEHFSNISGDVASCHEASLNEANNGW